MRVFHTPASLGHDPPTFLRRGASIPHPERAERYRVLLRAAREAGFALSEAEDAGMEPLRAVHTAGHLELLESAWSRREEMGQGMEELLTTHFARPQMHRRPHGLVGLLGFHTADTSTPIRADTWSAVYGSAQCAIGAADAALTDGAAYALCRPPGHHAYADSAGGFCFVNNTAVAAQRLRARLGKPVAILDIDVHHGNGTQGIFYARADVLTVSVHADTSSYFPFYSGYADETGEGPGAGFNLNLPIEHGLGDPAYVAAIERGLGRIAELQPGALVVALGLDASEQDPIGVLKVTTSGFAAAAETIARARLPTVIVQEGGYLCPALPLNLISFLSRFERAHA